jgi:ketose-bisphosphate aldolase
MALATLNEVLIKARKQKYGIGAYDFINMDMLYGILDAAEETKTPVIIQFPDIPDFMGDINRFAPLIVASAEKAAVPVVVHLDHGRTFAACKRCIEAGFTSVMLDASTYPYEENVRMVREVVDYCKPRGIPVEAELGHVGDGSDYDLEHYQFTDPAEAKRFVAETGIDALAVAIGNAHGQYVSEPKINFDILQAIEAEVSIPLVLHGGSGISDADFKRIIKHGVAKINIFTELTQEAEAELKNIPADKLNAFSASAAIRNGFKKRTLQKIALFETK